VRKKQLQLQDLKLANLNQTTTSNNQQTSEQAATTEPLNNICIFNDEQIAFQA
jgi:hypothetical protein